MAYFVDPTSLQPCDVLLLRSDDRSSHLIRDAGGSEFSHAMMYVGAVSCIEADGFGVRSQNLQRVLVESSSDLAVLRLRSEVPFLARRTLEYARDAVGMEYDTSEARQAATSPQKPADRPNRQFCSRFVAKAFEHAGVQVAPNPDYCSLRDLEASSLFHRVEPTLRKASSSAVAAAKADSSLSDHQDHQGRVLELARSRTGHDIQTFGQLVDHVIEHPEDDGKIAEALRETGYLDDWKTHVEQHPHYYDQSQFDALCPGRKRHLALFLIEEAPWTRQRYEFNLNGLRALYTAHPRKSVRLLLELYETLVQLTRDREGVAQHYLSRIATSPEL